MKTIETQAITIPYDFIYRPGVYDRVDEINKWVDEKVSPLAEEASLVLFKYGTEGHESKLMLGMLNDKMMMIAGIGRGCGVATTDMTQKIHRDLLFNIFSAIGNYQYADLLSIILKRIYEHQSNQVAKKAFNRTAAASQKTK